MQQSTIKTKIERNLAGSKSNHDADFEHVSISRKKKKTEDSLKAGAGKLCVNNCKSKIVHTNGTVLPKM